MYKVVQSVGKDSEPAMDSTSSWSSASRKWALARKDSSRFRARQRFWIVLLIPCVSIVGKCLKMLETYARLWWRLGAASCEGQELPHAYHAQAPDPHPIHQLLTAPAVPYGPASFLFLAVRLEPAVTLASLAGNISSKQVTCRSGAF